MATTTFSGARLRRRAMVWALRLVLLAILLGLWMYASGPGAVSALILPPITSVLDSFGGLLFVGATWAAVGVTVLEMILSFVIAAVLGVGLGFLLSRRALRARVAEPLLAWGYMFPFVLLYPLFLLWAGVGVPSKVAYAVVTAVFPIAYNTMRGLRSVDPRYTKVGVAFGASGLQMDLHIKAGAARPLVLSGLRIGVGLVSVSVVLAELLGSYSGLGHDVQAAASRLQIVDTYSLALLLVLVTVVLQFLMERALRVRHQ